MNIHALDGLRAFSVLWVCAYHLLLFPELFTDQPTYREIAELVPGIVHRGYFGVDIFFVMSGFLIASQLYAELDARGRIDLKRFYLRRALRLLPVYYLLLFAMSAIPGGSCPNVWANLLYVNNFMPYGSMCMPWTWSLAVEEQFYILFPLFCTCLFLARRRLALLLGALALLIAENVAHFFRYQHEFHIPLGIKPDAPQVLSFIDRFYDGTHLRIAAILIGVIAAYIHRYHFDRCIAALQRPWLRLSVAAGAAAGCWATVRFSWEEPLPRTLYVLWGSVYHTTFSLFAAALLLLALTRLGGLRWLHRLLSARVWFPIAQLSYSLYLVHPLVILGLYVHEAPTPENMPNLALQATTIVLVLAVVLYLGVERPFIALRRALERRAKNAAGRQ
jgi:peptidoglycan/LPS O-acetylase OafA/YrhL